MAPCNTLRLRGLAGMVASVVADVGGELVARGDARELTLKEFRRLLEDLPTPKPAA